MTDASSQDGPTIGTIVLPYSAARVTGEDLARIAAEIARRAPAVAFRPFDVAHPPDWLSGPFDAPVVTITLNVTGARRLVSGVPGRKRIARAIPKVDLLNGLADAGIPIPETVTLDDATDPDPDRFGPYVTVKTMAPRTTRGRGIATLRTREFARLRDSLLDHFAAEIAEGHRPVVQRFVETGPRPTHARVSCVLGHPVAAFRTTAPDRFDPVAAEGITWGGATSNASGRRTRVLDFDPEIVALGRRAAAAFPQTPVIAADIVRCVHSGALFCLEANVGNLAVLSAPICAGLRADLGGSAAVHAQFDAYATIADAVLATLRDDV